MKNKIRKEMIQKRKALKAEEVFEKSMLAQEIFLESEIYKKAESVMLYIPLRNEVDTSIIMSDAFDTGKNVLVPVTDSETYEISAYKITKSTEFEKGTFSVKEPKERLPFDASEIDVVLVPGVAFDRFGGRVGFGKGCYDKFLEKLSVLKIGFCYDFQLLNRIKTDKNDVNMEKEIIRGKL